MRSIYLDHNGSGPLAKEAAQAMRPWLSRCRGSSLAFHAYGKRARVAVETARAQVAKLLACRPEEVLLTSGGTEANNLAIKSVANSFSEGHLLISAIEHASVSQSCESLRAWGFETELIPVDLYKHELDLTVSN